MSVFILKGVKRVVIYEVNLSINPDIAEQFKDWLGPHVADILKLDGFTQARWFHRDPVDENSESETELLTIQYEVSDPDYLQTYFDEFAAAFRDDGLKRFPNQFTATRRVLYLDKQF